MGYSCRVFLSSIPVETTSRALFLEVSLRERQVRVRIRLKRVSRTKNVKVGLEDLVLYEDQLSGFSPVTSS